MEVAIFFVAITAVGWGLQRAAIWAEGRGWIYYRKGPRASALGNVMQGLDPIWNPAGRHRQVEERRLQDHRDAEADGAPPEM